MSDRGRNLFNQYILNLLADSETQESRLDADVEALKVAAAASNIRVSEIEEEVGALEVALANQIALKEASVPDQASMEHRVDDLKNASRASEIRISKIESDLDSLKHTLNK
jgi:hypothetical protein